MKWVISKRYKATRHAESSLYLADGHDVDAGGAESLEEPGTHSRSLRHRVSHRCDDRAGLHHLPRATQNCTVIVTLQSTPFSVGLVGDMLVGITDFNISFIVHNLLIM